MLKSLLYNAELRRNAWLELSRFRLIIMPVVIGALFFLMALSKKNRWLIPLEKFQIISMLIFVLLIFVWGTKKVSESVISEVNGKTWESQRITLITPGEMLVGKLFGSAIYPWYGGLFCIIAYVVASLYWIRTAAHLKLLLIMILIGLLGHAVALLISLISIRQNRHEAKIRSSPALFLPMGLLFILTLKTIFGTYAENNWFLEFSNMNPPTFRWYVFEFLHSDLMLLSLILFLSWAILGAYRLIRSELLFSNGPWAWICFMAMLMLYCSGFVGHVRGLDLSEALTAGLCLSFGIGIFMTYLMALLEKKDILMFRSLGDKIRHRQWKALLENLPLWMISLFMSLPLWVIIFVTLLRKNGLALPDEIGGLSAIYFVNLLCFVLRDLGILTYFDMNEKHRKTNMLSLILLFACLYIFPILLAESLNADELLPIFAPVFHSSILNGTLPVLAQMVFVFSHLWKRWKIRNQMG